MPFCVRKLRTRTEISAAGSVVIFDIRKNYFLDIGTHLKEILHAENSTGHAGDVNVERRRVAPGGELNCNWAL